MPGKPNISKFLIFFPTSSAIPQENPAALEARFDIVSISLNDCMISCKPSYHLNTSFRKEEELLDTY